MFEKLSIDVKIDKTQKETIELEIRHDQLNRDSTDLLNELEMTPDQLTQFIENKENFTEENWEQIQQKKLEIEQQLATDLSFIKNARQSQKSRQADNIAPHWFFVR